MSQDGQHLGTLVRSGATWGAANVAVSRLLQFATTVIVARLVAPEHFGALAVALAVQMIAMNASELGATASLARGHRHPDAIAPTVYTIALTTSTALTGLMIWTAPWVARTMGDPEASGVIRVMSLTVLLSGVSSVPSAMMWRDFQQKRRLLVDLANVVATTALVIPLALDGWEAMALAWSRVGGQVVATVMFLALSTIRYRPGLDTSEIGGLLRAGTPLALANVVVFATLNLDYLVIGRELGPTELGLYLLAFNLASLPSSVFTQILRTVAVPAFGRLHARGRLAETVPHTFAVVGFLSFPVGALLAGLAHPLVETIYGSVWAGAAAALVWLGVFAAGRTLTELLADLSLGVGRTGSLFWVQLVWFATLLPAMLLGVRWWGIAGAGIAHSAVAWLIVVPVYGLVIRRATNVPTRQMAKAVLLPALGSLLCGALAWWVAGQIVEPLLALISGGVAGAAIYLLVVSRPALRTVRAMGVLGGGARPDAALARDALAADDAEQAMPARKEAEAS